MRPRSSPLSALFGVIALGCSQSSEPSDDNAAAGAGGTVAAAGSGGSAPGISGSGGTAGVAANVGGGGTSAIAGAGQSGAAGQGGSGGQAGMGSQAGAGGQSGAAGQGGSGGQSIGGSEGVSGAAGSAGALGCGDIVSMFCDDFEAQTGGQPPTGAFDVNGDILVDSTMAYSGAQSIRVSSAQPGSTTMLQFTQQFPFNDLHGRAMMYMTAIPSNQSHWDVVYSYSENNYQWEVGGMFGNFMLVCDPPDNGLGSDTPFPAGEWFCLQWEFKYGGEGMPNGFAAKVNGVAVDKGEFTGMNANGEEWTAGPWQNLNVGWTPYQGSNIDIEMWIDDLAFGDQAIACP